VQSVSGHVGAVTLTKADVGLGQVDNTSDAYKPISTATQAALGLKLEAGDIAAFETNAQLDSRDTANRARANHTGSQAIDTISGLQTVLAAKLEAEAIANFEPTSALNARDTANRARANHTGTQPASSITGLASVATSGAYGDLSGRPNPAFTYDQQAEPVGPAVGATWRERSAGGLIVGEWEWSGSLWLGRLQYALTYSGITASSTPSPSMIAIPKFPALLVGYSVNTGPPIAPQDGSNFWYFRHNAIGVNNWLTTVGVDQVGNSCLTKILDTPIILTAPDSGDNRPTKVGSAGNLRAYQAISHYKIIRS